MKKTKIHSMQCQHYKGDGYYYKIGRDEEIWLCEVCEMNLLAAMKKQEVIENKASKMFDDAISKANEKK